MAEQEAAELATEAAERETAEAASVKSGSSTVGGEAGSQTSAAALAHDSRHECPALAHEAHDAARLEVDVEMNEMAPSPAMP